MTLAYSFWAQTFSYDPFGNLSKSGSLAWQPGYNQGTNQYTLAGCPTLSPDFGEGWDSR